MILAAAAYLAGASTQTIESRLRSAADAYYANVAQVARVTNRDSTMDYYWRLRNDADAWADSNSAYHRSDETRNIFMAISELDLSLATQLMRRAYRPMGEIRGLGETLVRSSKDGTMQPVAVYVPASYSAANPANLVVFMHGSDQAESHLIAWPILTQLAERTNTIVLAPYGRGYYDFNGSESDIYDALDAGLANFTIAPKHRYLAGYSMGGFSIFSVAPMRAGEWSAVLCVAGALVQHKAATVTATMGNIRFYIVTGAQDHVVPTLWPTVTATYLRDAGLRVSFYSQPDGTHDLRTLHAALPLAWEDMERGVLRMPWLLPGSVSLPVALPSARPN